MTKIDVGTHEPVADLTTAAALATANIFRVGQGSDEKKSTLTQLTTFMETAMSNITATLLSVASVNITGLSGLGSAMTFTVTGATTGALGAVTSGDGNGFGFDSLADAEYLIAEVLRHKTILSQIK